MKAFGAGFLGFIVGKASYASVLQERFLRERPYSELSQIIRKNRGMPEIEIPLEYQSAESSEYLLQFLYNFNLNQNEFNSEFHF